MNKYLTTIILRKDKFIEKFCDLSVKIVVKELKKHNKTYEVEANKLFDIDFL